MREFKDLAIGSLFYPRMNDGKMDLKSQLIKVGRLNLTGPQPWEVKTTPNVVKQKGILNSVVVQSIDGKTNGFYDFTPDDALVYVEGQSC